MSEQDPRSREQRFQHFLFIMLGQALSIFGSTLTSFALAVWSYQTTASVGNYALVFFAVTISTALLAPFAGSLVDGRDKKQVLLLSSLGSACVSLIIAILLYLELLSVWQIILLAIVNGVMVAFSSPAINATLKILLHPDDLARANGMIASSFGLASLSAPLAAGYLLIKIDLLGILLIDLVSFVIGTYYLVIFKTAPSPVACGGIDVSITSFGLALY